jgi:hypothetical protein
VRTLDVKSITYKRLLGTYRLHDWSEPFGSAKMDEHMKKMLQDGWTMAGQVANKDTITVTYTRM